MFDPDTGRELSPAAVGEGGAAGENGAVGEVCVRARTVMSRYLGDTGDSWLHTGDLGYLDSRGYLTLTGRLAGVIKTGGHKIYPAAIEAVLMSHSAIAHAVAYGVEDGDRREHIHAAIVVKPGVRCSDQELSDLVASQLSAVHAPEVFYRLAELPLTNRGKPDVARLRSHSAQRLSHR